MSKSNNNCSVYGCTNTYKNVSSKIQPVRFYSFPSKSWESERKKLWINFVNRKTMSGEQWEPTRNSKICSVHFINNAKSNHPHSPSYNPTIRPVTVHPGTLRRQKAEKKRREQRMLNLQGNEKYYIDSLISGESRDQGACLISDEGAYVIVPQLALVAASPVVQSAAKGLCHCQELSISMPGFSHKTLELFANFLSGKEVVTETFAAVTCLGDLCRALGIDCDVLSTSVILDKQQDSLETYDDGFVAVPMNNYCLQGMVKEEDCSESSPALFGVEVQEQSRDKIEVTGITSASMSLEDSGVRGDESASNTVDNSYKFSEQEVMEIDTDKYGIGEIQDQNHAKDVLSHVPKKSVDRYEKEFQYFQNWRIAKEMKGAVEEDVLVAYFTEKAKTYKSSTLWAQYSMLKATLKMREDVDIGLFPNLLGFLKRQSVGYEAKTSKILSRDDINKFLLTAPDVSYLFMKVALIFCIEGACRREDLSKLTVDDVKVLDSHLVVTVPETETHKHTVVTVTNNNYDVDLVVLYQKYLSLRPPTVDHRQLFLFYSKGKCSEQPAGINSFSRIPQKIAEFLALENPELYRGNCLRMSSATLLGNAGRVHR